MRLDQAEPEKGSLVLATAPFTQHRAGPGPSHFHEHPAPTDAIHANGKTINWQ